MFKCIVRISVYYYSQPLGFLFKNTFVNNEESITIPLPFFTQALKRSYGKAEVILITKYLWIYSELVSGAQKMSCVLPKRYQTMFSITICKFNDCENSNTAAPVIMERMEIKRDKVKH